MRDVTGNYAVTCFDGCLRVLIPDYTMKISTGSGSKVYDGTPLTVPECEITESDLPDTFSVTAEAKGSAWAAGKVRNTVRLEIIAPDGTDVSDFIYVEYDYGILEILPRPIIVQTASNSWEYDGETHWGYGRRNDCGEPAPGGRRFVSMYRAGLHQPRRHRGKTAWRWKLCGRFPKA